MKTTYDKIANVAYLTVTTEKVAKTIPLTDKVLIDVDKEGALVGVEILGATSLICGKKLATDIAQPLLVS